MIDVKNTPEYNDDIPTICLNHYAPRTPTTPQRRLLSCPQPVSPDIACEAKSICPSPTPMFQHLYHAVSYWERLIGRSPTPLSDPDSFGSPASVDDSSNSESAHHRLSAPMPSFSMPVPSLSPTRRMTIPSVHVLEYETRQVVTLDPVYTSHTDLDDISQPENGVVADVEISASDTESEEEAKEEEEQIIETPYVANESEVLGSVSLFYFIRENKSFVVEGLE